VAWVTGADDKAREEEGVKLSVKERLTLMAMGISPSERWVSGVMMMIMMMTMMIVPGAGVYG
jgi:hypothetical protein